MSSGHIPAETAAELFHRLEIDKWTFEQAKKMAHSFPTPLHKSFQKTCAEVERLQIEIHRLRGRLSHYEALESWE